MEPQILLEMSRSFGSYRCGKNIAMSRRDQCFLHSSCMLGSDLLCILLEFGVSWDGFPPCFFALWKGIWLVPSQGVLCTLQ